MKQFNKVILFALILFAGCGPSTKLTKSWSDKENTPQQFEKLGIAVLFPDQSNRYITERAVANQLKERGIKAMPTYDVFPFAGRFGEFTKDKSPDAVRKVIVDKINENNFDGFMIISLFDKSTTEHWVNDPTFMAGGPGYYGTPYAMAGTYSNYYYYSMGTFYNPGRYVQNTTYLLECNLYDVKTEKLIWHAQSKSVNASSIEKEADKLADLIGRQLIMKNIVTP